MKLYIERKFDAAHRLMHHPGKCSNIHGHTYNAKIWLEGDIDDFTGMVIDFGDVKRIIDGFDHALILNSCDTAVVEALIGLNLKMVLVPGEPTAEVLALTLLKQIPHCVRIQIWESPTAYAEA